MLEFPIFVLSWCVCVYDDFVLFCLVSKERQKEGMKLDGWEDGEELKGEGG